MKKVLLSVACCLALSYANPVKAQFFKFTEGTIDVGVSVGAANYYGDLAPNSSFLSTYPQLTRGAIGVSASRELIPNLNIRAGLTWARVKGSDAINTSGASIEDPRKQRNLSFRNDIKELAIVGVYYPLEHFYRSKNYRNTRIFQPYVIAGLSVFHHNPKAYYEGDLMKNGWYTLQPLHTEGEQNSYSRVQVALPFGGGLTYAISKDLSASFEIGWRKTFTDYLDDVSTNYADKGTLNNENGMEAWVFSDRSIELDSKSAFYVGKDGNKYPYTSGISSKGAVRGNSQNKDWFITTNVMLTYKLRYFKSSPKFR